MAFDQQNLSHIFIAGEGDGGEICVMGIRMY